MYSSLLDNGYSSDPPLTSISAGVARLGPDPSFGPLKLNPEGVRRVFESSQIRDTASSRITPAQEVLHGSRPRLANMMDRHLHLPPGTQERQCRPIPELLAALQPIQNLPTLANLALTVERMEQRLQVGWLVGGERPWVSAATIHPPVTRG